MRNLKKILALVLALVMTMSVMATAAFTDAAEIDGAYDEAADVLAALKVFVGRTDGSFDPKASITRAEVAAIIYRIATGDVTNKSVNLYTEGADFTDTNNHWAEGYIGYCNNAGYVTGYGNGKFGPDDKVTGMQAAAMILRAVGYDAQDEFTGAQWDKYVAKYAQELKLFKNIKGDVNLNKAVSREVVAEILFQAMQKDQVEWTPAFEYQPIYFIGDTVYSLGWENFKLYSKAAEDVFGRPTTEWYAYATNTKIATITATPVYENTVRVDECEISHGIGLTKATAIEKAYVDGEIAVVDNDGLLNPLATTAYIGAQGTKLEVYNMGTAGYRVVLINTYLAKVENVTAAYVDKNGHTVAATIDVDVYDAVTMDDTAAWDFNNVKAEGYKVGDYVLVTVEDPSGYSAVAAANLASVQSVAPATVTAGGNLIGWTTAYADVAATSTVGATTYKESAKFELNYQDKTKVWNVVTDAYGNLIGLVETATNYLVIEKLEWKHNTAGIGGGYALANLVLADGTKVEAATIAAVGATTISNAGDAAGLVASANASDSFVNNTNYYDHIFTYSVNANGSYNIAVGNHGNNPADIADATITQTQATIHNLVNSVVATDNTVFLVKSSSAYDYTVYVGKNNVPSGVGDICALTNSSGYATLVVVDDFVAAGNTFLAYVTDGVAEAHDYKLGTGYNVFKAGETTATLVYDDLANVGTWNYQGTGMYVISLNAKGQITAMNYTISDINTTASNLFGAVQGYNYDRVVVSAKESGTSIQTKAYSALTAAAITNENDNGYTVTVGGTNKDFNTVDTKVIVVKKNALNGTATLSEGTMANVAKNDVVIVAYKTVAGTQINNAAIIYVFQSGYTAPAVDTFGWKVVKTTMDSATGAVIEVAMTKNGAIHAMADARNLIAKVVVYDGEGTVVYTTDNAGVSNTGNGTALITPNPAHTLTAGAKYMAVVTISGSTTIPGANSVETGYVQAQTTVTP